MHDNEASPGQANSPAAGRGWRLGGSLRARAARVVQGASGRSPGERATLWGLVIVLAAYLALGALYAAMTPAWQVPDEPAHYNYVKYVAEHGQLPELRVGDYTADYLEQIKSQRFPPSLSIEPIRYESHQPPLYYVSAAIVYRLGQGLLGQAGSDRELAVLLRIFSMLIGGITLVVSYRIVRRVYAEEPLLALGTAAFMAFLPMHLAMNAGVNNDSLSELMLVLVVWRLAAMNGACWSWRSTVGVGILLGLALLTKMQAYVAVGVALFALGWDVLAARRRAAPRSEATEFTWPQVLARAGVMLGIALAVVSPWLVRNMRLYGPADPLGMVRHDQVVMGQLTTQQFVDQYGVGKLVDDLVVTTFHSFWGQFGWMGVLLHERIYMTLLVATMLVGAGLALYVKSLHSQLGTHSEQSRRGMALLFVWALGTTLVYLWYNTKYVQHQGRYLFPALTSWGLVFTLGLCTILRRRPIPTLIALGAVLAFLVAYGAWRGDIKEFYVALTVAAAAAIAAGHWLEERRPGAAMGLAYLGLCGLALLCLYVYVVPNLQPPA